MSSLTTRVRAPTEQDWPKLKKMLHSLKRTKEDALTLGAGEDVRIEWHLDAAFAVRPDFKSHTGATMTLGEGSVQSASAKQKVNTRSPTEAGLVSTDDVLSKALWTKRSSGHQGLRVTDNVVCRDNQSSMKLGANGEASPGKRARHFNIKCFCITDLIERDEIRVECCATDSMTADCMTRPVTGPKFELSRNAIMNTQPEKKSVAQQECVGNNNLSKKSLSQWSRVTQPPAATSHQ